MPVDELMECGHKKNPKLAHRVSVITSTGTRVEEDFYDGYAIRVGQVDVNRFPGRDAYENSNIDTINFQRNSRMLVNIDFT
jgi:hypothetical protein